MNTTSQVEKRVQLRLARGEDKAAIVAISRSTVNFVVEEDWLDELIQGSSHAVLVAVHGSLVVGFLIFVVRDDGVYITHMAVHESFRRCGVGSALMGKIKNEMQDHGKHQLCMVVESSDKQCLDFCTAMGFRSVSLLSDYYGRGQSARLLCYEKQSMKR